MDEGNLTPAEKIAIDDVLAHPVVPAIHDDIIDLPDNGIAAPLGVVPVASDPNHLDTVVHPISDTMVSSDPTNARDRESSVSNDDDVIVVQNTSDEIIVHVTPVLIGTINVSPIVDLASNVISKESVDLPSKSGDVTPGTDDDVTSGSLIDGVVPDVNKGATLPPPELISLSPSWHHKFSVKKNKKRPAQSPLMGKFLSGRRRLNTPVSKFQARNLFPGTDSDSCIDSDDDSFCWDSDSIASEILICEDFEGVVANNSDI